MKLSNQALGAIMMALQQSLMTQTDIVPVLKGFDLMMDENEEVIVLNPPTIDTSENNIDEIDEGVEEIKSTVGSD